MPDLTRGLTVRYARKPAAGMERCSVESACAITWQTSPSQTVPSSGIDLDESYPKGFIKELLPTIVTVTIFIYIGSSVGRHHKLRCRQRIISL
jgi:hypothetical protein